MGTVIDLVAWIVALLGVIASLGYGGYLLMLRSVAAKRPGAGHLVADARGRLPVAGGLVVGALVALLLTGADSVPVDVIGLLLGGGLGLTATSRLQAARRRLAGPPA